jgi:hypothetical protein
MCPNLPAAHKDSSIILAYKMGALQHLPKALRERLDDKLCLTMHAYMEGWGGAPGAGGGAPGAGDGGGEVNAPPQAPLQWTSDACDAEDGGYAFCILGAHTDNVQQDPAEAPAAEAVYGVEER